MEELIPPWRKPAYERSIRGRPAESPARRKACEQSGRGARGIHLESVSVPQSARSAEFPFRDGTTHFVFEPLVLIERLAALVPPPRMHQLTYHGVLAPGASWRGDIVPAPTRARRRSCDAQGGRAQPCHRHTWAELLERVFAVDALKCARCGSRRRWLAAITEPEAIHRILEHLGLESAAPSPTPPRSPPQLELGFEGC